MRRQFRLRRRTRNDVRKNPARRSPLVPDGPINHLRGFFNIVLYGITQWGDIFSPRQALALTTFARLVRELGNGNAGNGERAGLTEAVKTCLALHC